MEKNRLNNINNSSSLLSRGDQLKYNEKKELNSNIVKDINNLHMFVSISKFNYQGKEHGGRIYSSVFFNFRDPKTNRETEEEYFNDFMSKLKILGFSHLLVIDIGYESFWNNALKPYVGEVEESFIQIKKAHYNEFFQENCLKNLSKFSLDENITIILHFNNKNWATIKLLFKLYNIDISGNNNTIKHILSPNQYRLSLFLLLLFGRDNKFINHSFSNIASDKGVSRSFNDFTHNVDKTFINEIIKKNEKNKVSDDCNGKFAKENNEKWQVNKLEPSFTHKRGIHSLSKTKSKNSQSEENSSLIPYSDKFKENSDLLFYFEGIKNIVDDNSLNSLEKQKNFENYIEKFVEQQIENYDLEGKKGHLLNLNSRDIKGILYNALDTFLLHSKKNKNKELHRNILNSENKEKMGLKCLIITYGVIINYHNRLGYTAIAGQIGKIIMEYNFMEERREDIKVNKLTNYNKVNTLSFKEYLEIKKINDVELIRLGDYFISILSQYPHDIFARNYSKSTLTNKEVAMIEINPEYLETVRENLVISPANLPMLVEPVKWGSDSYGGYLKNSDIKNEIITKNSDNNHEIKNKTKLYEAVNILNSTKFAINTLLLNYLKNEGKYLLENDQIKDVYQRDITLKLADILSNSPFYLTVRSDWRGRIVTESFFLSYQGSDLSKSLIDFWEGESLTENGKIDFYIYGANCHNMDNLSKKSLVERREWVEKNKEKIINLDRNLILSAENIFSFASFCLNMKQLEKNPQWEVKSPIFLDATCSGIQHFAGLLRDVELAMQVNLTKSNIKDSPADVYSHLLGPINKAINDFGEKNSLYSHFKLINLDRNLIKQPVMTKLYNVTEYGISNQLQSNIQSEKYNEKTQNDMIFKDLNENLKKINSRFFILEGKKGKVYLTYSDLMQIAKIINDNIFIVFPSLKEIYDYFIGVVKILSEFNLPLWWITPCGMRITQHYLKVKENKTQFNVFNQAKKLVIRDKTDELSKARQIQGVIPNVIHSLDATHLIKVICLSKKKGFYPIIAIHDCFGTHPNKMGKLETSVKMEFISLYGRENYLKSFHKNIINNLRINNFEVKYVKKHYYVYSDIKDEWIQLPNYPKLGKFDLNQIKDSKYMIT